MDQHHGASVRTTVTLDEDVERMLREAMHQSRCSFKEALNSALRVGLSRKNPAAKQPAFVVHARHLGLRGGIDPAGLNRFVDDLESEAFLAKESKGRPR